jgi:hypothetical protein
MSLFILFLAFRARFHFRVSCLIITFLAFPAPDFLVDCESVAMKHSEGKAENEGAGQSTTEEEDDN